MRKAVIVVFLLTGCASNKVSVTDSGVTVEPGGLVRCTVMMGDNMAGKPYCLTYESKSCQVKAGDQRGFDDLQPVLQQISEQVVVAVPGPFIIQRDNKEVCAFKIGQHVRDGI